MTLEQILARKAELREKVVSRSAELTVEEIDSINKELDELEAQEKQLRAKQALDARMAKLGTQTTVKEEGGQQVRKADANQARALRGAQYKLKDKKAVSLRSDVENTAQNGILIPSHLDPTVDKLPWNEVTSLVDVVRKIPLQNGSEYTKAFQVSSDEGDYTLEPTTTGTYTSADDGKYHEVGVGFDKVTIKRNKITAITYESEELELLPDADYASIVESNVALSLKKKLAKEIVLGDGTGNHFVGIATPSTTTGLNANTYDDKEYAIDENLLVNLLVDYGGEEDIEGRQLLVMNKQTIKNFARVRDVNEKPVYNITITGNTFTIDGYRGIFSANIKPYDVAEEGDIWLVYGNFAQYYLLDFGGDTIETSKEFKFDQGITAIRGKVFSGGNLAGYKAFLRATKPASESEGE